MSETYRFLPFGERYAGNQTTHQFTGKERDAESGLLVLPPNPGNVARSA